MLAIRRQLREQGINPNLASQLPLHYPSDGSPPIPIWEHDPEAELRDEPDDDLGTDPAEEAFAAIGKFVKGATRTLFRRKSSKDVKDDNAPPLSPVGGTSGKKVSRSRSMEHLFNASPASTDPQKESEEGGVWEEEVGTDTWAQLRARTQTEITTSTTTGVGTAEDAAYKRTSTVVVGAVGKKKKTGTIIGRKSTTTETKVETKIGGKVETKTEGKAEAKTEGQSETRTGDQSEPRREGGSEMRTEGKAETRPEGKAETKSAEPKVGTTMMETTNTMTTTTATA